MKLFLGLNSNQLQVPKINHCDVQVEWFNLTFEVIKVCRETSELQLFILILEIMWLWFQSLSDSALNSWASQL